MNATYETHATDIQDVLAAARKTADGEEFLSRSRSADWLLDALNATDIADVREEIKGVLPDFSYGQIVKADEFVAAIDRISMAAMLAEADS
jgi:hypothetical protein